MEIKHHQLSTTEICITLHVLKQDYIVGVEKKIKEYAQKAQMKGFRAGKVPIYVIKQRYGKVILMEYIEKLLEDSLQKYINDHQWIIIDRPILYTSKNPHIDFDQSDFEIAYEIGIAEEFSINHIDKKLKITQYHITTIEDTLIQEALEQYRAEFGRKLLAEKSEKNDKIFGILSSNNGDFSAKIEIDIKNTVDFEQFIGLLVADKVTIASIQSISSASNQYLERIPQNVIDVTTSWNFTVEKINRTELAEVNQHFFDQVLGKDIVQSEQAFMEKFISIITEKYHDEAKNLLEKSIKDCFFEHIPINISEKFLKIAFQNQQNKTDLNEPKDQALKIFEKSMHWHLVSDKLIKKYNISVSQDEIIIYVQNKLMKTYFKIDDSQALSKQQKNMLDQSALELLKEQDGVYAKNIYYYLLNQKIISCIQENVTIIQKNITAAQFRNEVKIHHVG